MAYTDGHKYGGRFMRVSILGSGTSTGVPVIGCKCPVCLSTDKRDKRLRASALISCGSTRLLIDCGPDFRQQMLRFVSGRITQVLLSHEHYDHIGGLDDLRPMGDTRIYAEARVLDVIRRNMPYCFVPEPYPGTPVMQLQEIAEEAFSIEGIEIQPIRVMHAKLPILGYRIGKMAYLTDVKTLTPESLAKLQNLELLLLNALRPEAHFSHLNLREAIELARQIGARRTFFIHMSHDMGLHRFVDAELPEGMHLAYDGLELEL